MSNISLLIHELCKQPTESSWLEFKQNNCSPDVIGENISALANAATISGKSKAYMVWGVDDVTHEIVGTTFNPQTFKKGGQEIESWLRNLLSHHAHFEFTKCIIDDKTVILLEVSSAYDAPVLFKKTAYIKNGSYTVKLDDVPALQSKLWKHLHTVPFELNVAMGDMSFQDVLKLLDYATYFKLIEKQIPSIKAIKDDFVTENFVIKQDNGLFSITNLAALALAHSLEDFPSLLRKALRIVQYKGDDKLEILKSYNLNKGYALSLVEGSTILEALLPSSELIDGVARVTQTAYPMLAVREILANALIHQELLLSGMGPLVEVFATKIEVTNPGVPLVEIKRIVDTPPKSRNEKLAALMRRFKMCEELGSGWDRIVISCEAKQLPAPKISLYEENTKITLFAEMTFSNIKPEEKVWACYLHSCIKYLSGDSATNRSLRERFGLAESGSASISRLLKDSVEKQYIKPLDPTTAPRHMKYIPIWA